MMGVFFGTMRLQTLVMPSSVFGAPETLYVRLSHGAVFDEKKKVLSFIQGGRASFDTFFNGFTIHTWKKHTAIDTLCFGLKGRGKFILRFGVHCLNAADRWLNEQTILLHEGKEFFTTLKFWPDLRDGMLYFSLEALEEGFIEDGYFSTTQCPSNNVKLGIVITHFNRKQYVLPAVRRMREALLENPRYAGKIELIIIDNSRNIMPEEVYGVTLIPNPNYGGAGGFMRGLLYLKDEGSFTHCLFMDDDTSCEIESIQRSYALLSYTTQNKFAISGSLLFDTTPDILYDKGISLASSYRRNLDMNKVFDLLKAERGDEAVDYGAWWFFAFAIKDVQYYAFPFFVKVDDILFSLQNKFTIVTMNGINIWGESFGTKESPLTHYLYTRGELVLWMYYNTTASSLSFRLLLFIKRVVWGNFLRPLFSYKYGASVLATRMGVCDFMQGPSFWISNLDLSHVRQQIATFPKDEEKTTLTLKNITITKDKLPPEKPWHKLIRLITLNGFLLPYGYLKKETLIVNGKTRKTIRQIFRYKTVAYVYETSNNTYTGYLTYHNKKAFFKEAITSCKLLLKLLLKLPMLQIKYNQAFKEFTSETFWRQIYNKINQ